MKVLRRCALFVALVVALAACTGDDEDASGATGDDASGATDTLTGELVVATVPALERVVGDTLGAFGDDHPGVDTELELADATALVAAAAGDARPHVLVAADVTLDGIAETGVGPVDARPFGRDLFVIAVPDGNPDDIQSVSTFGAASLTRTIVCGPDSEIGNLALPVLANAGVTPTSGSVRTDCEDEVAEQVANGAVDAGLLVRTAVVPREDRLDAVEVPAEDNVVFELSYALLEEDATSEAFVRFLESDRARNIRVGLGYLP